MCFENSLQWNQCAVKAWKLCFNIEVLWPETTMCRKNNIAMKPICRELTETKGLGKNMCMIPMYWRLCYELYVPKLHCLCFKYCNKLKMWWNGLSKVKCVEISVTPTRYESRRHDMYHVSWRHYNMFMSRRYNMYHVSWRHYNIYMSRRYDMYHDATIWVKTPLFVMTPLYVSWRHYMCHDARIMCHDATICVLTPRYASWRHDMCHDATICVLTPRYV